MPISKYFKGHGKEVKASMRKAHPGASEKDIEREFYATANARDAKPKSDTRSKKHR